MLPQFTLNKNVLALFESEFDMHLRLDNLMAAGRLQSLLAQFRSK